MEQFGMSSDLIAFCSSSFTCKPLDNFLITNYQKIQKEVNGHKEVHTSASTARLITLGLEQHKPATRTNNNSTLRCIIS